MYSVLLLSVAHFRPAGEWLRQERPELRIIEPDLWQHVQNRLVRMRSAESGCLGGRRANYLLSGLLECGDCGSKMVIVSAGRGGEGKNASASKYICPLADRGVCSMKIYITREPLERRLLEALVAAMNQAGVQKMIQVRMAKEMTRAEVSGARTARSRTALKERIDRLADLIADGNHSAALLARLRRMEAECATLELQPTGCHRQAVAAQCVDLKGILLADRAKAKEILLRSVRLTAASQPQRGVSVAVWVGAGGRNRTADAGLFRAALYL